ncbi:MAG: ComF family protein [Actinomycetota bacterium]
MVGAGPLLDLLGRQRCARCLAGAGPLCPGCLVTLPPATPRQVPGLSRIIVPLAYEGAARALVLDLKLRGRRDAAAPLAEAMGAAVAAQGLAGDVLAWVPARRADVRARGFDHAQELAHALESRLGMPALSLLRRVGRARPDQAGLTARERGRNLRGAFAARRSPPRVVVVDDLVTTGATLRACATSLRRSGAVQIEAVVACGA